MVSRGRRNTSLGSGGCVVLVSSREERPGPPAAVRQASAVYGAARSGLVHLGGQSRSGGVPYLSKQLGARLQNLSAWRSRRIRARTRSFGCAPDQRSISIRRRADRHSRSAPHGLEHPADRRPAWPGTVDRIEGIAPQQPPRRPVPAVRSAPLGGPTQSPSSPAADRQEPRPMRTDRRAARSTVEPATDRPAPATQIPRGPVDAVVPRKHLSGCLPTPITLDPATAGQVATPTAAAHGQDSSPRSPAAQPASPEVRPADVVDPSAAIRSRRPQPAGSLGR